MILHIRSVALCVSGPLGPVETRRRNPMQYKLYIMYYILYYTSSLRPTSKHVTDWRVFFNDLSDVQH